jgi:hypothetical protein
MRLEAKLATVSDNLKAIFRQTKLSLPGFSHGKLGYRSHSASRAMYFLLFLLCFLNQNMYSSFFE